MDYGILFDSEWEKEILALFKQIAKRKIYKAYDEFWQMLQGCSMVVALPNKEGSL